MLSACRCAERPWQGGRMDSGSQTRLVIRTLQKLLKNQIPRPQPITAPDGKGQETARLKAFREPLTMSWHAPLRAHPCFREPVPSTLNHTQQGMQMGSHVLVFARLFSKRKGSRGRKNAGPGVSYLPKFSRTFHIREWPNGGPACHLTSPD